MNRVNMKKHWPITLGGGIVAVALTGSLFAWGPFGSDVRSGESDMSTSPVSSVIREAQAQTQVAETPSESAQPVAFPHDRHAGDFQIDCQYCHFSAERSMNAGIPAVATCMGCHTFVQGSQNPDEVVRLREFSERGEAIPWNRIYKVADHVQFPHMRHVSAGVNCTTCHGNVQEIGVIQEVNQPLTMGWCINCHIASEAPRDCTVCHY